jgi:anion-transporting  ArsA/GET3 family ATPase
MLRVHRLIAPSGYRRRLQRAAIAVHCTERLPPLDELELRSMGTYGSNMSATRLQLVVGKGGVGKSTVTAAIALAAARAGARVLALELARQGGLARIFGHAPSEPGAPVEVRPRLSIAYVEGEAALAEYLELIVPIRRLLAAVFSNRVYRLFVAAAPGLKELMTVGKIWYEQDRKDADGRFVWDSVVVDAGASGHSLQYLQMPGTAAQTFASGLVHREATRVEDLLKDPARTRVHVVALPEEMPVTEAVQIVDRLRTDLRLPIGTLFMNRCRDRSPAGAAEAVRKLAGAAGVARCDDVGGYPADVVLEGVQLAAERALAWEAIQERSLERLEHETGLKAVRLPFLVAEEFGIAEVERLADVVDAAKDAAE